MKLSSKYKRPLPNRSERPKFGSRSGPVLGSSEHRRFKIRSHCSSCGVLSPHLCRNDSLL